MRALWCVPLAAATAVAALGLVAPPAQAAANTTTERDQVLVQQLRDLLPANHEARLEAFQAKSGIHDETRDAVMRAIDPNDYQCGPTELDHWLDGEVGKLDDEQAASLETIMDFDVTDNGTALLPPLGKQQSFGLHGEYTKTIDSTFHGLRKFWDIDPSNIQLVAEHSNTILDKDRSAMAIEAAFGLSEADAMKAAQMIKELADQKVFDNGNYPLFSLNAFSVQKGTALPDGTAVTPKIALGDGLLTAERAIGFDDVSASVILSHEFGHHVQDAHGMLPLDVPTPEQSRRLELMADSFGEYYEAHHRGGNVDRRHLQAAVKQTFDAGDCQFDSAGHHGTPNQRGRAAKWGQEVALRATPPRYAVLPSAAFIGLFDRELPTLVAPDAPDTITSSAAV